MTWIIAAILASVIGLRFLAFIMHRRAIRMHWVEISTSSGGNFTLIALGDSTMQGVGATAPQYTAVGRIATYVEHVYGKQVHILNLSKAGAGIDDVLSRQLANVSVDAVDLIIISIGANDMLHGMSFTTFTDKYAELLGRLPKDKIIVADVPNIRNLRHKELSGKVWNPRLKPFFAAQNVRHALIFERIRPLRFNPRLLAADCFHPSNFAYKLSAEAFEPAIDEILKT